VNLYKVTLRGMNDENGHTRPQGVAYVVAEDSAAAYQAVRDDLDASDIGFAHERELKKVELIASQDIPSRLPNLYVVLG